MRKFRSSDSIAALCKVKKAGLAKHIGVANFNIAMIEDAIKLASEPIAVLQIETHPYLDQTKVIAAARRHGMAVVGYCPLARGKVPGDETLQRIGRAHGKIAVAGGAALSRTGRYHSYSADLEARAARRKSRQSRFQAQRRGDDGDRQIEAAGRAHRQSAASAEMGH